MSNRTISETLFERLCLASSVPCEPIVCGHVRTPDFAICLSGVRVVCEVKQVDPNAEDLAEAEIVKGGEEIGRLVANRLRQKLKDVSAQLKAASLAGNPTLLVIYDNTSFKAYTDHFDVVQALFGDHRVAVRFPEDPNSPPVVSDPFFGGNRRLTPHHNTSVSALAILDGGPIAQPTLRVYHNPYASVILPPEILGVFPVTQKLLPGATNVAL
jgi:hypothetical protein